MMHGLAAQGSCAWRSPSFVALAQPAATTARQGRTPSGDLLSRAPRPCRASSEDAAAGDAPPETPPPPLDGGATTTAALGRPAPGVFFIHNSDDDDDGSAPSTSAATAAIPAARPRSPYGGRWRRARVRSLATASPAARAAHDERPVSRAASWLGDDDDAAAGTSGRPHTLLHPRERARWQQQQRRSGTAVFSIAAEPPPAAEPPLPDEPELLLPRALLPQTVRLDALLAAHSAALELARKPAAGFAADAAQGLLAVAVHQPGGPGSSAAVYGVPLLAHVGDAAVRDATGALCAELEPALACHGDEDDADADVWRPVATLDGHTFARNAADDGDTAAAWSVHLLLAVGGFAMRDEECVWPNAVFSLAPGDARCMLNARGARDAAAFFAAPRPADVREHAANLAAHVRARARAVGGAGGAPFASPRSLGAWILRRLESRWGAAALAEAGVDLAHAVAGACGRRPPPPPPPPSQQQQQQRRRL